MVGQGLRTIKRGRPGKAQVLLAKALVGGPAQHPAQLRVVTHFEVRIQRQMVGKQVDVIRQQQPQTLAHPASDAAVLATPEKAVVHKNGVGPASDGRFDQRPAGRHATHQAGNIGLALDLQTVGAVVLETFGL